MQSHPNNDMRNRFLPFFLLAILLIYALPGCKKPVNPDLYHAFPSGNWERFNILRFEIPVEKSDKPWSVILYARFKPAFSYEKLNFNMVMNTSAGEERIAEYEMPVRSASGVFVGKTEGDSCRLEIMLKRQLMLPKTGVLKIEIENLTPRLITEGVSGVGIRMVPSAE